MSINIGFLSYIYSAAFPERDRSTMISSSPPKRFQRKIRAINTRYIWFLSMGSEALTKPSDDIQAEPGDLFVHMFKTKEQIWIKANGRGWEMIVPGDPHPTMPAYRLHVLDNGEPRWITRKTATTYRGRQRRHMDEVRCSIPLVHFQPTDDCTMFRRLDGSAKNGRD